MISKEEFMSKMSAAADEYAWSVVENPEEHLDAVEAISSDYMEGAIDAYLLVTNTKIEHDNQGGIH